MIDDFDDGFDSDFDDGYDGDFDGGYDGDDFGDDGFGHHDGNADTGDNVSSPDPLEWQDWMIIGPMSEDIARERKEREQIRKDMFGDD